MEFPLEIAWLVLLVISIASIAAAIVMIRREWRSKKERDKMFEEATAASILAPPTKAIEDYENKRAELFENLLERNEVVPEDEDLGEGGVPDRSWHRKIAAEDKKQLKVHLLRRAFQNIPRWMHISSEINGKFRLFRHGLLDEETWVTYQNAQQDLQEELDYIRLEAECIEDSWGEKILRDSMVLHRLKEVQTNRMKEQEIEEKKKQRDDQRRQQEQQQKKKAMERRAEKLADQLLKEEEQSKQHAAKKAGGTK